MRRWTLALCVLGMGGSPAAAASRESPSLARAELAAGGASVAWRVELSLRSVDSIASYDLVDGILYAMGTDGVVRAIRADTGRVIWIRMVMDPPFVARPPTSVRAGGLDAAVFTRAADVVLYDAMTGDALEKPRGVRLMGPAVASAAAAKERVFVAETGRRLRAYDLDRDAPEWRIATQTLIHLPPAYVPEKNLVVCVDDGGRVSGLAADDGAQTFGTHLDGKPTGFTVFNGFVLVATTVPRLHVLDLNSGEESLAYRLPQVPIGGPIATKRSVYQRILSGMQHVGLDVDRPSWRVDGATRFLAEWPGDRAALWHEAGRVLIVNGMTGEAETSFDAGSMNDGVSNPLTDAVILTSPRGDVVCLRPAGAPPLTLDEFRPAILTTKPAEAETKPAGAPKPPAAAKEETPKRVQSPREPLPYDPLQSPKER